MRSNIPLKAGFWLRLSTGGILFDPKTHKIGLWLPAPTMKRILPLPLRPLIAEERADTMSAVRPYAAGFEGVRPIFLGDPVLRFRVSPGFCVRGLQSWPSRFSMDRFRGGFRRPAHGGRRVSGARAAEGIMAIEAQDTEFRHPDTAAYLRGLTDEEAAKQPPLVREQDSVAWHYWREGGRVCCREAASGTEALHAAVEAEFGRSLRRLEAELRGGGVPDLDAIETWLRDRSLAVGAKVYADLLEARDAALPAPACPSCGRRMERHGRAGKTFEARMGPVRIECQCRSKIPQKCRSRIPHFFGVLAASQISRRFGSPFWAALVFSARAAA